MKSTKSMDEVSRMTAGPGPDLEPLADDPWQRIVVPMEWEPVARICIRIRARLDAFTDRVVEYIWHEIPFYSAASVPRDDVTLSVFRNLDMLMLGLAESRGPTDDELAVRRELGNRRAAQGLPADALLMAYHVGFRELWKEMVAEAANEPPGASTLLLTAASTVWEWVHRVTNTVAESYHDSLRASAAQFAGMRQRMLELIRSGEHASPELASLTASLGFDPKGTFRACAAAGVRDEHPDPATVQEIIERVPGVHLTAIHRETTIVLSQGDKSAGIVETLGEAFPQGWLGVGLARAGLAGARQSIDDASDALGLAVGEGRAVCFFEERWALATLRRSADRLETVLTRGTEVAVSHPHLAEAVIEFAESRLSVSAAARALTVHSNTVAYRLRRWQRLTGWDPHTFEGLAASLACLADPAAGSVRRPSIRRL